VPYSTQEDVRLAAGGWQNLVELADVEQTFSSDGGAGLAEAVAAAIREADGVINSYLGQRYLVPVVGTVDTIRSMSAAWAVRVLRRARYKGQPMQEDIDQEKIARAWLTLVAKGEIQLGVEPIPEKGSVIVDRASSRDGTLDLSREKLKGFI
jgi:phage gp36-like protein